MMMSITHRITGVALYFGTLLVVWWLVAAMLADDYFNMVQALFASWLGRIVLFGFTWALVHHALGGLRHFIWDLGAGFKLPVVERMVRLNLIGSILISLIIWAIAYGVKP
jgi:succinate dehydrogenase / fumarate reductase cytochrome b subunit